MYVVDQSYKQDNKKDESDENEVESMMNNFEHRAHTKMVVFKKVDDIRLFSGSTFSNDESGKTAIQTNN